MDIKIINAEQADSIIKNYKPLGLFMLKDKDVWVGIDNHDGNAWTEEYATKFECERWLKGEENE